MDRRHATEVSPLLLLLYLLLLLLFLLLLLLLRLLRLHNYYDRVIIVFATRSLHLCLEVGQQGYHHHHHHHQHIATTFPRPLWRSSIDSLSRPNRVSPMLNSCSRMRISSLWKRNVACGHPRTLYFSGSVIPSTSVCRYCCCCCQYLNLQNKKTATTMKKADKVHFSPNNRHMDDFLFQHRRRLILVAVLALRLDRLRNHRRLRRTHRSHRSEIPPQLSRHRSSILWHLGRSLARPQSRRHGMYLVWCARLDRRDVRLPDDSIDLAFVGCIWSRRE